MASSNTSSPSFSEFSTRLLQSVLLRIKSWSPQLVPVLICLGALPFLLLFSIIAGWLVWSTVPQGWTIPVHLQYGDGTSPYANLEITSLSTSQPYEISLHLTVPATESNFALGNFMTSLRITTYSNVTITDVRRPALVVPPASSIIPLAREPRLLHLTVPLVSGLVTGISSANAHIELGRKDSWKSLGTGAGREISVYASSLHGVVRPQGLRRVVAVFPMSFAVAAGLAFFVVSTAVLSGFVLPLMIQSEPEASETKVKAEESEAASQHPAAAIGMRRRSSRVKEESDIETSPLSPETESDVRRRGRRSSRHDDH